MKVNFGCGRHSFEDYVNVDVEKDNCPDLVMDMNSFPYPFKDGSVSEIRCYMTLEHIEKPFQAIIEFYRILEPDGKVSITVPHASSVMALHGEYHLSMFWVTNFYWFKNRKGLFEKTEHEHWTGLPAFKDVHVKLRFPQGVISVVTRPFQFLFGEGIFAQNFYEYFLSGIVRCSDIEVEMVK